MFRTLRFWRLWGNLDKIITDAKAKAITAALSDLDMAPNLLGAGAPAAALPPALNARMKVLLAISSATAVGAEVVAWTTGQETSERVMILAALSILSAGLPTLKKGWIALETGRSTSTS